MRLFGIILFALVSLAMLSLALMIGRDLRGLCPDEYVMTGLGLLVMCLIPAIIGAFLLRTRSA